MRKDYKEEQIMPVSFLALFMFYFMYRQTIRINNLKIQILFNFLSLNFSFVILFVLKEISKEKQSLESMLKFFTFREMLQSQIILQYFYKLLIQPTFSQFSSKPTINITFSFTNNHSLHQQFVKKFVSLALLLRNWANYNLPTCDLTEI